MNQQSNITEYNLSLTELLDTATIQKVQTAFAEMAGIAAFTTDADGAVITEASNFTEFCRLTQSSPIGEERCKVCNRLGTKLALKKGRPVTYPCHTDLLNFSSPIVANGKVVGCLLGGQIRIKSPNLPKIRKIAEEIGVDPDAYCAAVQNLRLMSQETVDQTIDSLYTISNIISDMAYSQYLMHHANEELNRAANMKSDFLANMSHEIRTPMNAVIGMAEMALREDLPPAARGYVHQIKTAGKTLLTIINDVLDFSKIESGKMAIVETDYEPMSMINDVANIIVTRLEDKNVELILDISPTLPNILQGDSTRIKQVLLNLANNAAKFTMEGHIILKVYFTQTEDKKIELHVSVEDTGIGIKEEDINKLFTSFLQLDSKRNRNIEGTGLGLAISEHLLHLMNGRISVESEYEKGSIFSFTVPQEIIDATPSVSVKNPREIRAAVLAVNDSVRFSLVADLRNLGVDCMIVRNFKEMKDIPLDKTVYFFVENYAFTAPVQEYVRENPEVTAVLLIKYDETVKYDLPNLIVLKKPLFILNIAAILNGNDLHFQSSELEKQEDEFTAPDAHILIVDDSSINLTVAEGLLRPLNMNIDTALSGKIALQKIRQKHYDIIFMDHMMPDLDGVETTRLIRRFHLDYNEVPIIALTANAVEGTKQMFLENGMNDFVAKPIELRTLLAKVKEWLPVEKVRKANVAVATERQDEQIHMEIGDLDTDSAVKLLGSPDLYLSILTDYYNLIEKKADQIKVLEETANWPVYTIEVHALKSASRQIGANSLADKAAELEKAGNIRDTDFIQSHTDEMLEQYRSYLSILKPFCAKEEKDDSEKTPITIQELTDYFAKMREAIGELDMDSMEEITADLGKYSYDSTQKELFTRLKSAADMMDVDECEDILKEWEALLA